MKSLYVIERHTGRNWIETDTASSKTRAFEILQSYELQPFTDAFDYRIVKLERSEVAWLDIREQKNRADHDA